MAMPTRQILNNNKTIETTEIAFEIFSSDIIVPDVIVAGGTIENYWVNEDPLRYIDIISCSLPHSNSPKTGELSVKREVYDHFKNNINYRNRVIKFVRYYEDKIRVWYLTGVKRVEDNTKTSEFKFVLSNFEQMYMTKKIVEHNVFYSEPFPESKPDDFNKVKLETNFPYLLSNLLYDTWNKNVFQGVKHEIGIEGTSPYETAAINLYTFLGVDNYIGLTDVNSLVAKNNLYEIMETIYKSGNLINKYSVDLRKTGTSVVDIDGVDRDTTTFGIRLILNPDITYEYDDDYKVVNYSESEEWTDSINTALIDTDKYPEVDTVSEFNYSNTKKSPLIGSAEILGTSDAVPGSGGSVFRFNAAKKLLNENNLQITKSLEMQISNLKYITEVDKNTVITLNGSPFFESAKYYINSIQEFFSTETNIVEFIIDDLDDYNEYYAE